MAGFEIGSSARWPMEQDVRQALEDLQQIDEADLEPWSPMFDPLAFAKEHE